MEIVEDIRLLKASEIAGRAYSFGEMIGHSFDMEELFRIMPIIAQTDSSVLITGETGTGKDLAASALGWGRSTLWRKINQYGLES